MFYITFPRLTFSTNWLSAKNQFRLCSIALHMHRRGLVSNYQLLIIITVIRPAFASAWRPSVAQSMSAVVIASILFALLLAGFLRAYVNHEKQTKACQIAQNVRQFSCRLIWWHSRFGRQNGSGGLGRSNAGHVMNDCPSNAQMLDCQAEKVLRKAVAQKTEKEKKNTQKGKLRIEGWAAAERK